MSNIYWAVRYQGCFEEIADTKEEAEAKVYEGLMDPEMAGSYEVLPVYVLPIEISPK